MNKEQKTHESYGMISISKFNGNGNSFFGSDVEHEGGVSITISKATVERDLCREWYHPVDDIIQVDMSPNQYVDAITSGMNTSGVPCTIRRIAGKVVERDNYISDKKELFSTEMTETQQEFISKIDNITELLKSGNGAKVKKEALYELDVLKNHLSSNTNFVLKQFNEAMDKTVLEAKQSISSYIDNKVHTLGIEGMKKEFNLSIESK